jgi:hypothetical protein
MGITPKKKVGFTQDDVLNRDLVIKMLKFEEELTKSEYGQNLYKNPLNNPFVSLTVEKALNRKVLSEFGFDTSDYSVEMYRTIFKTYFHSPTDYDEEVISSVHYMRENRCVFYENEKLEIGQSIPNCPLYTLEGSETTLFECMPSIINDIPITHTVFAGFSLS